MKTAIPSKLNKFNKFNNQTGKKSAGIFKLFQNYAGLPGFTLIEVVVAAFVIIVGISGVFGLLTQTYSFTTLSSMDLTAAYLGKEGVEMISSIRDSNLLEMYSGELDDWVSKIDACSLGCEMDFTYPGAPSAYGGGRYLLWDGQFWNYSSGEPSRFKRKITTDLINSDELMVHVEIFWSERGRDHVFKVQEKIYKPNWL